MVSSFNRAVSRNVVLELDKIMSNVHSTVRIYSNTEGASFRAIGYIQGGMSISGSNQFNTELAAGRITNMINEKARQYRQYANASPLGEILDKIPGVNNAVLQTAFSTIKSYIGSNMPTFKVQFLLLSYRAGINTLDIATTLQAMVMPLKQSTAYLIPPLNFISGDLKGTEFNEAAEESNFIPDAAKLPLSGQGTLNVAMGNYFYGTGLVCSQYSWQASEEVVEDGTPLYIVCNADFEAKRAYDIVEFRRYFKGLSSVFENQLKPDLVTKTIDDVREVGTALSNFNPLTNAAEQIGTVAGEGVNGLRFVGSLFGFGDTVKF